MVIPTPFFVANVVNNPPPLLHTTTEVKPDDKLQTISPLNPLNRLLQKSDLDELLSGPTKEEANVDEYRRAFRHKSYCLSTYTMPASANEYVALHKAGVVELQEGESNERLEFLGDAVLGLIVAEYLFMRYPDENEGFMTQMRASLVNGEMLARLGRIIGIQRFVLLSKGMEAQRHSKAVVEDAFEAFVGAMFLSCGLDRTKAWFFRLVEENLDFAQLISDSSKDMLIRYYRGHFNRSLLFTSSGRQQLSPQGTFHVRVIDPKNNHVLGEGQGATKRDADNAAAKEALRRYGL